MSRLLIIFLIAICSVSTVIYFYTKPIKPGLNQEELIIKEGVARTSEQQILNTLLVDAVTPTSNPKENTMPPFRSDIAIGGWIPHFDFSNGLNSFKYNKHKIKDVHLSGGYITESGALAFNSTFDTYVTKLHDSVNAFGLNIISTNANATKSLVTNETNQKSFWSSVLGLKTKYANLQTVNLNFEKVHMENKQDLVEFLKETKKNIQDKNIKLVITFFGTDTDTNNPYDYKGIGENVDEVILMAYDYVLRANRKQGFEKNNVPDFWVSDILNFAKQYIPAEKITIGLPLYGYGFNKTTGKITSSYTYLQIQKIIETGGFSPQHHKEANEMYLERGNEIIYFQSPETLNKKIQITKDLGINKVFFWRLGGEGVLLN